MRYQHPGTGKVGVLGLAGWAHASVKFLCLIPDFPPKRPRGVQVLKSWACSLEGSRIAAAMAASVFGVVQPGVSNYPNMRV